MKLFKPRFHWPMLLRRGATIVLFALASQASAQTPGGTIKIVKISQPNHAQDFLFTPNFPLSPPFYLDDDPSDNTRPNSKTFSLPAGNSYSFTESMVSGWNLASIICLPANGTIVNIPMRMATIALTAGANVTCTFTNVKPPTGQITIVKVAKPNDAQAFKFTPSVATIPAFFLDDDPSNNTLTNSKTFTNLPAGSSTTFTETQMPGWSLASIICTPSAGTITTTTGSATIVMAAGAHVTCTFTNVKLPPGMK